MARFPKFPKKKLDQAKKWAVDDKKKYIMYIVKHDGEKTFVTGATKRELTKFRKQQAQDYRATRIVKAPTKRRK